MPLVSVITTCFNAQECIKKTIESVLSQTFNDFEYIIMDGASKDATVKLAREYEEQFSKRGIAFSVYSQKDSGIYEGMNNGVKKALGDYVCFMNADDEFFDEKVLESIFSKLSCPNEGETADRVCVKNSKEAVFEPKSAPDIIYGDAAELEYGELFYFVKDFSRIKERMPFSHQSVFAKRELLLKYPFDMKYKIAADYNFLVTCYENGCSFMDSEVLVCRVSKDGLSSVRLYDTFMETEQMLNSHGIYRYTEKQLKKKLFFLKIRQFGMDYLPHFVKKIIRKYQRKSRGQDRRI